MTGSTPEPKGEGQVAVGQLFRAMRKKKKVGLSKMASELGVSINTLRWHENGSRPMRVDMLIEAARVLGCTTTELIEAGNGC